MPGVNFVGVKSLAEVEKEKARNTCDRMADHSSEGSLLSAAGGSGLLRGGAGGSETDLDNCNDTTVGGGSSGARARSGLDSLQQKILKVTEQLKIEQTARDENVAEYLKLVNSADKQQMGRIRQVFEKKNQKSAQSIAQLHKKLEGYHRRMRDSENNGAAKHSANANANSSSTTNTNTNHKDGTSGSTGNVSSSGGGTKTASKDSLKELLLREREGGVPRDVKHPSLEKTKAGLGLGAAIASGNAPPFFLSKPREFANLIRNKFGSADNIAHLKSSMEAQQHHGGVAASSSGGAGAGNAGGAGGAGFTVGEGGAASRTLSGSATIAPKPKYGPPSDDEGSTGTSESVDSTGQGAGGTGGSQGTGDGVGGHGGHGGQNHNSSSDAAAAAASFRLAEAMQEVREIRKTQLQIADDMEALKGQFKREYGFISQSLQEERYRYARLEDQLNDLTELHQNETANLKQELASIEEKVAYQAYERARDIQEVLEACQTRVSKLELQQQQQQIIQLESADAKVLLGKCINIMLAIATVILVCVSTAAKFTAPLLRSRLHVCGTFLGLGLLAVAWKNWEHLQHGLERLILPN
ncbi:transmembrane and coiled-coil domain protein 3-like [Engraulis encrasicolus]|uniref:transmembrane and coiled-coil domain protein 3-like n=1 Tax=Engraulis encrasicolus TaxID=184585 RepID=UPI002FD0B196